GEVLLVDCPHPIRKMMREAGEAAGVRLDVDRVRAVALTHLHADHCSGLEGLGYFSYFVLGRPMPIACHPSVLERLWDGSLAAGMERLLAVGAEAAATRRFEDYFGHVALDEHRAVEVGPFSI